jgi:hypothetical protein
MGFFTNIITATVKVALTPVAIVKDVVNVATGEEANATKDLLKSAGDDASKVGNTLLGERDED